MVVGKLRQLCGDRGVWEKIGKTGKMDSASDGRANRRVAGNSRSARGERGQRDRRVWVHVFACERGPHDRLCARARARARVFSRQDLEEVHVGLHRARYQHLVPQRPRKQQLARRSGVGVAAGAGPHEGVGGGLEPPVDVHLPPRPQRPPRRS